MLTIMYETFFRVLLAFTPPLRMGSLESAGGGVRKGVTPSLLFGGLLTDHGVAGPS